MFGPHVTNLGDDERRFTARHTAYYLRRAVGGCGIVVTEGASVHDSDWPYERAPLANRCAEGWREIAECVPRTPDPGDCVTRSRRRPGQQRLQPDAVVGTVEGSGGEQSRDAEVDGTRRHRRGGRRICRRRQDRDGRRMRRRRAQRRAAQLAAPVPVGFDQPARRSRGATTGCCSLARRSPRFVRTPRCSGCACAATSSHRGPGSRPIWHRRSPPALLLPVSTISSCVRGSIYSTEKTRPDFHEPTGFNIDVCRAVKVATASTPVFLQGSIVDSSQAEWAIDEGVCDGVEMTRAQIAEPDLVAKLRMDHADTIRPCIRCNQTCQVRDVRNPIVSCVGEPSAGRETEDPDWYAPATDQRSVLVVGGGVAGLEAARVAATRGHRVAAHEKDGARRWNGCDRRARCRRWPRGWRRSAADLGSRSPPTQDPIAERRRHHPMHGIAARTARVRDRRSFDGHRHRRRASRCCAAGGPDCAVRPDRRADRRGACRGTG